MTGESLGWIIRIKSETLSLRTTHEQSSLCTVLCSIEDIFIWSLKFELNTSWFRGKEINDVNINQNISSCPLSHRKMQNKSNLFEILFVQRFKISEHWLLGQFCAWHLPLRPTRLDRTLATANIGSTAPSRAKNSTIWTARISSISTWNCFCFQQLDWQWRRFLSFRAAFAVGARRSLWKGLKTSRSTNVCRVTLVIIKITFSQF